MKSRLKRQKEKGKKVQLIDMKNNFGLKDQEDPGIGDNTHKENDIKTSNVNLDLPVENNDGIPVEPTFDQKQGPTINEESKDNMNQNDNTNENEYGVHNMPEYSIDKRTSGWTEIAHNYVDGMMGKLINDYSDIIHNKDDEQDSDGDYSVADRENSIEKRISDVDESQAQSSILDGKSNTSTVRNMANDYVSNLVESFK